MLCAIADHMKSQKPFLFTNYLGCQSLRKRFHYLFHFVGSVFFKRKNNIINAKETNNSIFLNNARLLLNLFEAQLLHFVYKFWLPKEGGPTQAIHPMVHEFCHLKDFNMSLTPILQTICSLQV